MREGEQWRPGDITGAFDGVTTYEHRDDASLLACAGFGVEPGWNDGYHVKRDCRYWIAATCQPTEILKTAHRGGGGCRSPLVPPLG